MHCSTARILSSFPVSYVVAAAADESRGTSYHSTPRRDADMNLTVARASESMHMAHTVRISIDAGAEVKGIHGLHTCGCLVKVERGSEVPRLLSRARVSQIGGRSKAECAFPYDLGRHQTTCYLLIQAPR